MGKVQEIGLLSAGEPLARDADTQNLLYRYMDSLYRARSLAEIYDAALTAICEGLDADRASILRFDAGGVMRFVAWRGLSEGYRKAVDGHTPWTLGEQDTDIICVPDIIQSGEPAALVAAILKEDIRGLCFIPLAPDDRVIGKFMVYYRQSGGLTGGQRELALTIARQLGFALQTQRANSVAQHLAALVEGSEDAIISTTLDGIITSWNAGATKLLGYRADEAIGRSIKMLIQDTRHDEEEKILAAIREGKRLKSFETVRRCKDGRLVDLSLTISPVMDDHGEIIGASKIARDISERRQAAETQALLLAEMNHRVKNAYALTSSLIQLNSKSAPDARSLARIVTERLSALSRAHALTQPSFSPRGERPDTLHDLLAAILSPFEGLTASGAPRIVMSGGDEAVDEAMITPLALSFHELATNAAKYGSLSVPTGQVAIEIAPHPDETVIYWRESGGPPATAPTGKGFGSKLLDISTRQVGALEQLWSESGLLATIRVVKAHSDQQQFIQ